MPPAVAAVASLAVAVVSAEIGLVAAFLISTVINISAANYAKSHQPNLEPADNRRHTARTSNTPLIILYGKRRISGPLVHWATGVINDGTENSTIDSLVMCVAFAEHEFDGVEKIYLGERVAWAEVPDGDEKGVPTKTQWNMHLGVAGQTADPILSTKVNPDNAWTADHKGEGVAYISVYLHSYEDWDAIPDISVIARGSKIYDPRKDNTNGGTGTHRYTDATTWEYSNNPALVARDYLTREEGFGEAHTKIDDAWVIQSANTCDVQVDTPGENYPSGPFIQQNMYSCDLAVSLTASRQKNLLDILDTMKGEVVYVGGVWKIMAGEYLTPTVTITEADILGDFTVSQSTSAASTYNYITGTYYDEARFYQDSNFEPQANATFEARDNGRRISKDLKLTGVTNEFQAQRLATLELNQSAHQTLVSFTLKPTGPFLDLHVSSMVKMTLDNPSWVDKSFRIFSWELNADLSIKITARDENSGAWDVPSTIYINTDAEPAYDPYDQLNVKQPTNVSFDTGQSTSRLLKGGAVQPVGRLNWTSADGYMIAGYRTRWRPASVAATLSEGMVNANPKYYFKGDEVTGLDAVNSASSQVTGTYDEDTSTAGMSVAGLNPIDGGNAIDVNGSVDRILSVGDTADVEVTRDFTAALVFKVTTAEQNICMHGQWGETLATQVFKIGTMSNSTNICAAVRDASLFLHEIDSGSDYDDSNAHLLLMTMSVDTLTLEIDGITVATRNLSGKTLIFNPNNPFFVGGGASSIVDTPSSNETSIKSLGPKWYWKLDETTGLAAVDAMGNGNLAYESDASTAGYSIASSSADASGQAKDISAGASLQIYDPISTVIESFETSVISASPTNWWKLNEATSPFADSGSEETTAAFNTIANNFTSSLADGTGISQHVGSVNTYIQTAQHAAKISDISDFTIEFAFYQTSLTGGHQQMVGRDSNDWYFTYFEAGSGWLFRAYESDNTIRGKTIPTAGIALNEWHYVSVRMDITGTQTLSIKIDGVEYDGQSTIGWSGVWNEQVGRRVFMGKWSANSIYWAGGKIDQVQFYRRAITDEERDSNYSWWENDTGTPPPPVPTGYIAYYTMNLTDVSGTTLNDVSGTANVHNAILVNSPGVGANGHIDKAIFFNSFNSEHATIVDHNDFHMTNLTVSFWTLLDFNTDISCIFQSGSADTNIAGWNIYTYDDGGIQINIGSNTGSVHGTDHKNLNTGTTVNDSFWHHVAFTYDGTTIKAYVDGVLTNSTVYAGGLGYEVTNYVRLGSRNQSGTELDFLKGTVDDLKIYASVKTAAEIAAITAANPPVTADTVAFNPAPNGTYTATHASLPAVQTFSVTNLGAWNISGFGTTNGIGSGWYRTDNGIVDDTSYEIRVSYTKTGTGTVVLTGMVYKAWQPLLGGESIQLVDESSPTGTTLVITIEIRETLDPTNTTGGTIFTFDCTGEAAVFS